jgi:CubicO group peptidase (beta-lactamase class C family)
MKSYFIIAVLVFVTIYAVLAHTDKAEHAQEWQPKRLVQNDIYRVPQSPAFLGSTELESFIIETMEENNIPGLASCIIKDGDIVWSGCFGYANIEQNKEVTDTTTFSLASVSKTFTATALMQLWEDGLFDFTLRPKLNRLCENEFAAWQISRGSWVKTK